MGINMTKDTHTPECMVCGEEYEFGRWKIGKKTCMPCGDKLAVKVRESWTVLTPHKQGAMFFTAESALEMAKGINNKGGLIK
jgi:hypothetical protein